MYKARHTQTHLSTRTSHCTRAYLQDFWGSNVRDRHGVVQRRAGGEAKHVPIGVVEAGEQRHDDVGVLGAHAADALRDGRRDYRLVRGL